MIDSSVAGLGGCPYAKGATGNVATEDVLTLLKILGVEAEGVDAREVFKTGEWICEQMGRESAATVKGWDEYISTAK